MIKKLVIIGDTNTGKTTWVQRLVTGNFIPDCPYTIGVEAHPVRINDEIVINIWDCAGKDKFFGLAGGYFINSDAAIIFVDSNNPNITKWVDLYKSVCPDRPYVVVASKSDIIDDCSDNNIIYISCKTGDNILEPLERLL